MVRSIESELGERVLFFQPSDRFEEVFNARYEETPSGYFRFQLNMMGYTHAEIAVKLGISTHAISDSIKLVLPRLRAGGFEEFQNDYFLTCTTMLDIPCPEEITSLLSLLSPKEKETIRRLEPSLFLVKNAMGQVAEAMGVIKPTVIERVQKIKLAMGFTSLNQIITFNLICQHTGIGIFSR